MSTSSISIVCWLLDGNRIIQIVLFLLHCTAPTVRLSKKANLKTTKKVAAGGDCQDLDFWCPLSSSVHLLCLQKHTAIMEKRKMVFCFLSSLFQFEVWTLLRFMSLFKVPQCAMPSSLQLVVSWLLIDEGRRANKIVDFREHLPPLSTYFLLTELPKKPTHWQSFFIVTGHKTCSRRIKEYDDDLHLR